MTFPCSFLAYLVFPFLITTLIEAKRRLSPRSYNKHKGREREIEQLRKRMKERVQICLNRPPDTAPLCHKMDSTRHAVKLLFIPSLDNHSTVALVYTGAGTQKGKLGQMSQSDRTSYSPRALCGLIAFVHWCQWGHVTLKDLICNWAQLQWVF